MREDTSNITEQGGLEEGGVRVVPVGSMFRQRARAMNIAWPDTDRVVDD